MYQIVLVDQNAEIPINEVRAGHTLHVPAVGEHIMVKWNNETRICEVSDVWTHINLDSSPPQQGAVQVLVRWVTGLDPALYIRRFRTGS